jgi:hypothetical protein
VLNIERTGDRATITFGCGTCTLQATDTALVVRIEAADSTALGQAETLVAHRIQTSGSREQLTVEWQGQP